MKYIVASVTVTEGISKEMMFAFPNEVVHEYHAAVARVLCEEHGWSGFEVVSAGSITPFGECGGESSTLGLKSRGGQDTQLWLTQDYGGGLVCD